jgi:prolyl oligopeptidase
MTSHPVPSPVPAPAPAAPTASAATDDPYLWLEDIEGPRAMEWVNAHNVKSLGTLQSDPRYEKLHADALRIVEATDRIAMPDIRGHTIYNFWQDPSHVRGILRRTTPESYRSANPEW